MADMYEAKNTQRAVVRIGYDGRVHKEFRGPQAEIRFENEMKVLKYLEARKCDFVPRLLDVDPATLTLTTTTAARASSIWANSGCKRSLESWKRSECATTIHFCAILLTEPAMAAFA